MKADKKNLKQKIINKYRLVILNENTFEEQVSFKISRLNVLIAMLITSVFLVTGTIFLISFSPLREYIPGYSSTKLMKKANRLAYTTDSLLSAVAYNDKYYASIKKVLRGELKAHHKTIDSIVNNTNFDYKKLNLRASEEDLKLRKEIEEIEKYNLPDHVEINDEYLFFPPAKAKIITQFDISKKQYNIRLSVDENTPIKAIADGVVLFSGWNPNTGYVIIIKHRSEIISVYHQEGTSLKKQGDRVTSGEVIAMSKSTNSDTEVNFTFELWDKDKPINPTNYINFQY